MKNNVGKVLEMHAKSRVKLNPFVLTKYLKRDYDVIIVDRQRLINEEGRDYAMMFFIVLNDVYKWNYCSDASTTTVYFEPRNGVIYGGVYDEASHTKRSTICVAAPDTADFDATYIYTGEKIEKIMSNIAKNS